MDDLQGEETFFAGSIIFGGAGEDAVGRVHMAALLFGEVAEKLADGSVLSAPGGGFVEFANLVFHEADLLLNGFEAEWANHPEGAAFNETANVLATDEGDVGAEASLK